MIDCLQRTCKHHSQDKQISSETEIPSPTQLALAAVSFPAIPASLQTLHVLALKE